MERIAAGIFAIFVVIPSLLFVRNFFRDIKEEDRWHQDAVDDARRRAHWRQTWRRK